MGWSNPELMQRSMPARIWRKWLLYYEAEPWSEEREDMRTAIVASVVYHALRGKSPRRPISDFMVDARETRKQNVQSLQALLRPYARKVTHANH